MNTNTSISRKFTSLLQVLLFCLVTHNVQSQNIALPPVTPKASAEAVTLLNYIYSISGEQTLSGQHCAPLVGSTRLSVIHRITNQYPAVFGQDFGFSYPGYW